MISLRNITVGTDKIERFTAATAIARPTTIGEIRFTIPGPGQFPDLLSIAKDAFWNHPCVNVDTIVLEIGQNISVQEVVAWMCKTFTKMCFWRATLSTVTRHDWGCRYFWSRRNYPDSAFIAVQETIVANYVLYGNARVRI